MMNVDSKNAEGEISPKEAKVLDRILEDVKNAGEAKHTPRPWAIFGHAGRGSHPNHAFRFIGTADFDEASGTGEIIAKLTDSPAIVANARLISAAPDLLAACELVIRAYGHLDDLTNPCVAAARAAVAKALARP